MALKYIISNLSYLAEEQTFRSDINYIVNDIKVSNQDYYLFDELFEIVPDNNVNIENLDTFEYVEIGNITSTEDIFPVYLDKCERNDLNENYFKKIEKGDIIKVQEGDILVSKVRPYLKKIILIDKNNKNYYYTSAFIHIRPRKSSKVLYYIFKGYFINYVNSISRQGKGYPTLSEKDLHYIKFNKQVIDSLFEKESEVLEKILPIEKEIGYLKKDRVKEEIIIDKELQKYFDWDYKTFFQFKSIKKYNTNFISLANNYDCRMSAKFHRPAGTFVYNDITSRDFLRVKDYTESPIVLGASVSPADFDSSGDYYYISMATIKNYKVELDETQLLSNAYSALTNKSSKMVKKNDIIMTRSGAAIGKFAIVEEDIKAIHSDFTMKIRMKDININFAYYYFRSLYFQYLIEIHYKGLQNNNIFPNQVQDLPIPHISLSDQQYIVNKIEEQLDIQKKSENKIKSLRDEIDNIILKILNIPKGHVSDN